MTPSPRDVVRASLAAHLDDDTVEARADLIVLSLRHYGHLSLVTGPPTTESVAEAARTLALASRHPRYVDVEDGWHRLVESEVDVYLAYTAAVAHTADEDAKRPLAAARAHLLRAHAVHKPSMR